MKDIKQYNLLLLLLGAGAFISKDMQASMRHIMHDDIFGDFFDDNMHYIDEIRERMMSYWPSKEEREAIKTARMQLAKIQPQVTETDQNVIITFALDNVDKKSITIGVKEYVKPQRNGAYKAYNVLKGLIPAQNGKVEFYITKHTLDVARQVALKRESKTDKSQTTFHQSASSTQVIELPQPVEITKETTKAQTKDNNLIITIAKKKQAETAQKQQAEIAITHEA
jgi:HSP20 family molecular chaperone IbpA